VNEGALDQHYMRLALLEARRGLGRTSPNPAVGAVLVADGKIISRAHHRRAGGPHAEVQCLQSAGKGLPKKATLYVTLEPCSTIGQTGRCTDVIVRAGLRRVVVGTLDLNPRHQGRGIKILQNAGIDVQVGVLGEECSALNEAFNKWITTGRPFVIAKCGMTLDGHLTRRDNEPRWITSSAARRHAHALRAQVDAILVGAETIRADDPRLTVRGVRGARQPWRVVVTRSGKLPSGSKLFRDRFAGRTLIYRKQSLDAVLTDLGKKNVTSVLIEGGGNLLGWALDARLIDKIQIYIAPLLSGGPVVAFAGRGVPDTRHALQVKNISYRRLAEEICVTGYLAYPSAQSE
jgi:diaminohydroxyphosphoribosylaminopyrimidine deaminase/5-amino-6-(5-phosphoribosylamino)uracil reductase